MTPERWQKLTGIFHAALERSEDDRHAFLTVECGDDTALRHEVEAMLAENQTNGPLSHPAYGIADSVFAPGTRLGPYEIVSLLGSGGMGEVFRARDTRLRRDVAIKRLSSIFATDPGRLERFEREARVLASLNHPNIASIYGLELTDTGTPVLVLELVEGRTLAEMLEGRATGLPLAQALAFAREMIAALEAAHEKGIIHRDLKPANIKITPDGTLKLLDFGLAKASEPTFAHADSTETATETFSGTRPGLILGTAGYMSPEQARGQIVDKRADIWAFGCVLYEMLTGRRAFDGHDLSTTLASVLRDDVRWDVLPPEVPAPVRRLLRRCLEKDPKRRLSAIADARLELDDAADASEAAVLPSSGTVASTRQRHTVPVALATIVGGLLAGVATWYVVRPSPTLSRVERFVVSRGDAPPELASNTPSVWMSPDGARIVYRTGLPNARTPLMMRDRGMFEPTVITGTEGGVNAFFSPDGTWLAFFDSRDNTLRRMPAGGGPSQIICKVDGLSFGGSWGHDDQIVFATINSKGLMRVPATGGEPQRLTTADINEAAHFWPEALPGGQGVLFTAWNGTPERSRIAVLSASNGEVSTLIAGGTYPRYASSGHLLFVLGGTLRAARFDPSRLALTGESRPMVDDVALTPAGGAHYAIGNDGSLAYGTGRDRSEARALVWVDRQGRQEAVNLPPRPYAFARVSPDGSKLALDIRDQQSDIWIWDLTTETLQNLTLDPGQDRMPVWTPDGAYVAFNSRRDGQVDGIFWRRADGSGPATRIDTGSRSQGPTSISPDGKRLIFLTPTSGASDIGMLTLGNSSQQEMLVTSSFDETNGVVSPDGRWLAYESNESGRLEIYVRPFPDVAASRQLVSSGGGTRPLWSKDGRELFYWVDPGTVMAVTVKPGATLTFDKPIVAVKGQYVRPATVSRHYDLSADGKRFLLMIDPDASSTRRPAQAEVRLVLRFFDELNRLVGGS